MPSMVPHPSAHPKNSLPLSQWVGRCRSGRDQRIALAAVVVVVVVVVTASGNDGYVAEKVVHDSYFEA